MTAAPFAGDAIVYYRPAALAALLCLSPCAFAQGDPTKAEPIRYDQLGKLVRSLQGKPVVVYVWHES